MAPSDDPHPSEHAVWQPYREHTVGVTVLAASDFGCRPDGDNSTGTVVGFERYLDDSAGAALRVKASRSIDPATGVPERALPSPGDLVLMAGVAHPRSLRETATVILHVVRYGNRNGVLATARSSGTGGAVSYPPKDTEREYE